MSDHEFFMASARLRDAALRYAAAQSSGTHRVEPDRWLHDCALEFVKQYKKLQRGTR